MYDFFDLLNGSGLATIIRTRKSTVRSLKKSKVFLTSPNAYFALSEHLWRNSVKTGNLRECLFAAQTPDRESLLTSELLDFTVDTPTDSYEVEIGGPSKTGKQAVGVKNALIFKDGIEHGFKNTIPLYLAGFQY